MSQTPKLSRKDVQRAEDLACGGTDFCFICKRATDHWGEHSRAQIVEWTEKDGIMQSIFWAAP